MVQLLEEDVSALVGGQRFTTFERVQFRELTSNKKKWKKNRPFEREKLAKLTFYCS